MDLPPPPLPPPPITAIHRIEVSQLPITFDKPIIKKELEKVKKPPKLPNGYKCWVLSDKYNVPHYDTDYYKLIETVKKINH